MKPQEKKEEFILARVEGKSFSTIAKELNISKTTCANWQKEFDQEISKRKSERLEELFEMYSVTRTKRIEAIGELSKKLYKGIMSSSLCYDSVCREIDLYFKCIEMLKKEFEALARDGEVDDDTKNKTDSFIEALNYTAQALNLDEANFS